VALSSHRQYVACSLGRQAICSSAFARNERPAGLAARTVMTSITEGARNTASEKSPEQETQKMYASSSSSEIFIVVSNISKGVFRRSRASDSTGSASRSSGQIDEFGIIMFRSQRRRL
jgi:Mg-chelatase subunit ChlD